MAHPNPLAPFQTLANRIRRLNTRRPNHLLPFRIPFFRIFYSTTYTTLYLLTLAMMLITPVTLAYTAIRNEAYQYPFMVGGTYALTAIIAIFIYASRLYTNRTVLAGVGKAYIPVEEGEVGKGVRKIVAAALERSVIVAWESRPRDLRGEIMRAVQMGTLPDLEMERADGGSAYSPVPPVEECTLGREIPVDPAAPPWGEISHPGWSSPSLGDGGDMPDLQYDTVVKELPHLVEARAVSLAPEDPRATPTEATQGQAMADPVVADVLRRPPTMGMRDYLTQLSYLSLINPPELGEHFLHLYERARFAGRPVSEPGFADLMTAFSSLLAGMTELDDAFIDQIRTQNGAAALSLSDMGSVRSNRTPASEYDDAADYGSGTGPVTPRAGSVTTAATPVTAPMRRSTPYEQLEAGAESVESFSSVVRRPETGREWSSGSSSGGSGTSISGTGSVVVRDGMG